MITVFANTKGGVGKSTQAVNTAVERARAGRKVWLIDCDAQRTAQKAIINRMEAGIQPGIACDHYLDGPTLRAQLKLRMADYDDIIIDVGGYDSTAMRAALVLCDTLIVPFQPRSFDVWAFEEMAPLVDEARSVRDGLKAYCVLNQADPGPLASDNHEAAKAVAQFEQFEYLNTPIRRRKAFSNAVGMGQSVCEIEPHDAKAVAELKAFISAVF